MRVRIIAGEFGGRLIDTPGSSSTHPMGERVRGAIFNKLAGEVQDATVLDAFAGSGALGLEALSRGAQHVTFLEKHRIAAKIVRENVTLLGVGQAAHVVSASVSNWLETSTPQEFDIIFADPPYHDPQFSTVSRLLGLLKVGGSMVLSHPGRGGVPDRTGIVVVDNRSYGNAYITLYRRVE